MASKEMKEATERTLAALRERGTSVPFADLVQTVAGYTSLDEATIKAAILRLNSEGELEITSDWSVRVDRPTAGDSQAA